ncbi:MAG TPA: ABC transporter permease [Verrucomicrobiae bacterium]|jgi:lipopolysaccharide transport system permease protein|nr:ABC transporter permease [Verrucomicrobiae bacterium]
MPELIIEAGRAERNYWRDLWRYRELFYFLAWRDILVRYKQTVIGVAWAVIRPFLTMIVLTVTFGMIAKLSPPGGVPYALVVMAGILPWQFFANSISESSNSLIGNANLISKVYFPRLVVPAGSVITSFVDFLITLVLMGLMMAWFGFVPDWRLLFLPLFVVLAFGAAFGAGLWLCALNVEYRDFRYIIPFVVQFGVFVSPVGWTSSHVPLVLHWHGFDIPARFLYSFNPLVGVINGFRWTLLRGVEPLDFTAILSSVAVVLILCCSGFWYFRRMERGFADII